MTRNKRNGLLLIVIPTGLLTLVLTTYSIVRFFVMRKMMADESVSVTLGLGERSPFETTAMIINVVLGLLGTLAVIGMLIGIPVGIYFLAKKETEVSEPTHDPSLQGLTSEQIAYIQGWSWGAFFGGFIWPLGNKLYWWSLGRFVPLWNIYVWIHLSIFGRSLAWKKGWRNFEQFRRRQQILGVIIIFFVVLGIGLTILRIISNLGGDLQ